jgi:hypothetical protein
MLVLAIAAICLAIAIPFGIEVLKRPRLRIDPEPWVPKGSVPWIFAVVRVRNEPLRRPWSIVLRRDFAAGCELIAEFRKKGQGLIREMPCRWSAAPEPFRKEPLDIGLANLAPSGGTAIPPSAQYVAVFDSQAVTESYQLDIAPRKEGSEAAVAILVPEKGAFAFNGESYAYDSFAKPDWKLEHAEYEVTVVVRSGQITKKRVFSLTYLDDDFSKFKLGPIE